MCTQASFGFSVSVKTAKTECKQHQDGAQNIDCGMYGTVNNYGPGNVVIYPVNCNIQAAFSQYQSQQCMAVAAKAGDIATFGSNELPKIADVNNFNLGKINGKAELNIKAPGFLTLAQVKELQDAPTIGVNKQISAQLAQAAQNAGALVSFTTQQDLPLQIYLRRRIINAGNIADLDAETEEARAYKQKLKKEFSKFPNNQAILTFLYRKIPGMQNRWTEIWSFLDNPAKDMFEPNFNLRIYQNGLVVVERNIDKPASKKHPWVKNIFPIGDFNIKPADKPMKLSDKIAIGGGKFATPADV